MSQSAESRPGKLKKTAYVVAIGALAVVANKEFNILGHLGIGTDQRVEVPPPRVKVTKITPIDLGCFVTVESDVDIQADVHNRISVLGATKTISTDTTKEHYHGDADLCVDNNTTTVLRIDEPNKPSKLIVTLGGFFVNRPRINHDGQDVADYNPSWGTRLDGFFGAGGNENVQSGLDATGQFLIGDAACVTDAVNVANSQVTKHYDKLALAIGDIQPEDVTIAYQHPLPQGKTVPQGDLRDALSSTYVVPQDWDVSASPLTCATLIDGKPAVAEVNQQALGAGK